MDGKLLIQILAWTFFVIGFIFFGLGNYVSLFLFLSVSIVLGPLLWYLSLMGIHIDNPATSKKFLVGDAIIIVILLIATYVSVTIFGSHIPPNNTYNQAVMDATNSFKALYSPYLLICPLVAYILAIPLLRKSPSIGFLFLFLSFVALGFAWLAGIPQHLGFGL